MPDRSAGLAVRLYRRLLWLFPKDFRRRWGPDMEGVFELRMEKAGIRPFGRIRAWIGIIVDVLSGAAREWWDEWRPVCRNRAGLVNSLPIFGNVHEQILDMTFHAFFYIGVGVAIVLLSTTRLRQWLTKWEVIVDGPE